MNALHGFQAVVLAALASSSWATTIASSNFDSGDDGWTARNGAQNFEWLAAGGDPGGFIQARDDDNEVLWFFAAPAAYLGNVSAAFGGNLSYSLRGDPSHPPLVTPYADVQLLGNNGVLLVVGAGALPVDAWAGYSVTLVADGSWKRDSLAGPAATEADFDGVLSSLRSLRIRGDYRQGIDTTSLDSVSLVSTPVPEPATWAMLLAGLASGLLLAGRRISGR